MKEEKFALYEQVPLRKKRIEGVNYCSICICDDVPHGKKCLMCKWHCNFLNAYKECAENAEFWEKNKEYIKMSNEEFDARFVDIF